MHALEKAMATHSSVLAWRIPGTEEPDGLLSMGSHGVRHDCSDLAAAAVAACVCMYVVCAACGLCVYVVCSVMCVMCMWCVCLCAHKLVYLQRGKGVFRALIRHLIAL